MLDLFRFVLIRPPRPIKKGERHELTLSSAGAKRLSTTSSRARREAASKLLAQASAPADASLEAMQAVLSGTGNGATAAQIEQTASVAFGAPLQSALKNKTLASEVEQASENLILAKLASSSEGLGLEALATLVCGYDLLTRALAHGEHGKGGMPVLDLTGLRVLWVAAAFLLLCIASTLAYGAYRIQRLIALGRRSAPRAVPCMDPDEVFKPDGALRVPPPDRWLAANEGEMVPWGWLDRSALWEHCAHPPLVDRWYWQGNCRADLVRWVQGIYRC
jgi:hypothetical protein